ncbi:MAG: Asp-tRNA(Asn)/Glu-tRNA(Gln) amidotransferase subunit GatC [Bdellovibrionaceae bacterium]|nr:Asp-tRNA(Asn)/Glu-tRNA(Gln) amidotransferase subunit GatC [Pseudobdellovibrionaceae bacterium]
MISQETIRHIAKLARLEVTDAEANEFAAQLSAVFDHFQEIAQLDTAGVEPMITPSEIALYLRSDQVERQETVEDLLENAPEKSGHLFKVPPVV